MNRTILLIASIAAAFCAVRFGPTNEQIFDGMMGICVACGLLAFFNAFDEKER